MVIRPRDNPYLKKEDQDEAVLLYGECLLEEIHVCLILSSGSGMPFHLFLLPETDKEQRIYKKQHVGVLLLNTP